MVHVRRWAALAAMGLLIAGGVALADGGQGVRQFSRAEYIEKVRGGWAGQMVGVSYGSVYEFQDLGRPKEDAIRDWQPEFVENSIGQDDLYVDMTFLAAVVRHGLDVTYEEAGRAFADSQYGLWHANFAGRTNVRNGILPPLSGDPEYNPHFDDIDFQIEADALGLVAPGLPQASDKLGEVFGHVMNYGDGVYGGMWVGAMYAMAYFETDVDTLVREALGAIPAESTYAACIRDVIAAHQRDPEDWRAAWQAIEDKWGHVDTCPDGRGSVFNIDAKLNGAYIAIGLLYGAGDFERTMEIATRCGQDSDCNPASAAGVLGTLLGYDGIPERFTAGIPKIADTKFAYTDYGFNDLAEVCADVAEQVIVQEGGEITATRGSSPCRSRRRRRSSSTSSPTPMPGWPRTPWRAASS
jgi:hypothetical protein